MQKPFKNLVINQVYSNQEVTELIKKEKLSPPNPPAFTYNRWNIGMAKVQPFFEYMGNAQYKYIGEPEESNYSGRVVHNPKESYEYQIALWKDGKLQFLNPEIKNFKDWKDSDENGILIVSFNVGVTLNMNGNLVKYMIKENAAKNTFENGYKVISKDSALAKELLGTREGDTCMFGPSKILVEIVEIH